MMARRKGGGEEGGIDGKWGDEGGREHRSLVVRNGEQGGGERIPSPRWHLLLLIITMVGDDDFWS